MVYVCCRQQGGRVDDGHISLVSFDIKPTRHVWCMVYAAASHGSADLYCNSNTVFPRLLCNVLLLGYTVTPMLLNKVQSRLMRIVAADVPAIVGFSYVDGVGFVPAPGPVIPAQHVPCTVDDACLLDDSVPLTSTSTGEGLSEACTAFSETLSECSKVQDTDMCGQPGPSRQQPWEEAQSNEAQCSDTHKRVAQCSNIHRSEDACQTAKRRASTTSMDGCTSKADSCSTEPGHITCFQQHPFLLYFKDMATETEYYHFALSLNTRVGVVLFFI